MVVIALVVRAQNENNSKWLKTGVVKKILYKSFKQCVPFRQEEKRNLYITLATF